MPEQAHSGDGYPSDLLVDLRAGSVRGLRGRLENALRAAIQDGRLVPGAVLPPSRILAAELAISRSVVVEAYANLRAEGYLEARHGSGTRVRARPDRPHPAGAPGRAASLPHDQTFTWYRPPQRSRSADGSPWIKLFGGLPDPALFPRATWLQHYRAALTELPDTGLSYPDMLGAAALRAALAAYLGRVRGVATAAERVVVCSGFTQGLGLTCRALRRRGARRVAVEDPCHGYHREVIARSGLEPVPVRAHPLGLDPGRLPDDVQAVLVAPAHSYPAGATLGADRRHALIAWARRTGALVIEDDYDSEFRYDRQPIGAIQGLAPDQVLYVGSASKTVSPALRLGWMAAPGDLADALEQEKLYDDMGSTLLDQLAFARFVDRGGFSRHLRQVRPVYRSRRDAAIDALAKHLPEARWVGEAAGLHLHVMLPDGVDEREFRVAAYERGVLAETGSWHWARPHEAPPSFVLGYGGAAEPTIRRGIQILAEALRACRRNRAGVAGA